MRLTDWSLYLSLVEEPVACHYLPGLGGLDDLQHIMYPKIRRGTFCTLRAVSLRVGRWGGAGYADYTGLCYHRHRSNHGTGTPSAGT